MSNYSKNLAGLNQKVFVSPAIEYTDDTTYTAFISNAVEGEIGVFLDTGAVRTTLLTSGLKFFIAQKRDGNVNKTPLITFGTDHLNAARRTAYDAPVKKVVSFDRRNYHSIITHQSGRRCCSEEFGTDLMKKMNANKTNNASKITA